MKILILTTALASALSSFGVHAEEATKVYLNENLGFNVQGFNYQQNEFPCEVDQVLVKKMVSRARSAGLDMEPVHTADKVRNGVIPVVAIDIDELVFNDEHRYGTSASTSLPKVEVTAAVFKNDKDFVTAKHTCAIATLNEFSPSSSVLDMGTYGVTVCSATHKCLNDLSKDIVTWVASQVK